MSQEKGGYHHGDLANALVLAATRIVEGEGHERFSLREAAREVGVSANAAYRHFEGRSAILTEVARSGFRQLAEKMLRSMTTTRGRGDGGRAAVLRFQAVGRAYIEFAVERPELFDVMFGPSGARCLSSKANPKADDELPTPFVILSRALDELVVHAVITPKARVGAELKAWAAVHGLARLSLDAAMPIPAGAARDAEISAVLDFVVAGLANAGASSKQ